MNPFFKKKLFKIFHFFGGDVDSFPLEQRMFNVMVALAVFVSFIGAYHNFALKLHPIATYPSLLGGLIGSYFYYNSRIKGHYKEMHINILVMLTIVIISIVYFNNSGSSGSALFLLLSFFNIYLIVSNSKHRVILLIVLLADVTGLYYAEYMHPEWILLYTSPDERFWDMTVTFTYASIFMFAGTMIFKRSYNNERKKVSEQNRELSILNKKIQGQKTYLEQQTLRLEQSIKEIEEKNRFIYSLMKEVNHRVKNNLQLVSSLLNTQEMQTEHKEVKEALRMAKSRIISISLIHQKLYKDEMELSIELGNYIEELAEYLIYSSGDLSKVNLEIETLSLQIEVEYAVHVGLIINELITNSLKHAWQKERENKNIIIKMGYSDGLLELVINDNGRGFVDTKSLNHQGSFGLKLVQSIVEQYDGNIQLSNTNGAQVKIDLIVNR